MTLLVFLPASARAGVIAAYLVAFYDLFILGAASIASYEL